MSKKWSVEATICGQYLARPLMAITEAFFFAIKVGFCASTVELGDILWYIWQIQWYLGQIRWYSGKIWWCFWQIWLYLRTIGWFFGENMVVIRKNALVLGENDLVFSGKYSSIWGEIQWYSSLEPEDPKKYILLLEIHRVPSDSYGTVWLSYLGQIQW